MNKKKKIIVVINHYYIVTMVVFPLNIHIRMGERYHIRLFYNSYTKYHKLQENDAYYDATEFLLFPL